MLQTLLRIFAVGQIAVNLERQARRLWRKTLLGVAALFVLCGAAVFLAIAIYWWLSRLVDPVAAALILAGLCAFTGGAGLIIAALIGPRWPRGLLGSQARLVTLLREEVEAGMPAAEALVKDIERRAGKLGPEKLVGGALIVGVLAALLLKRSR